MARLYKRGRVWYADLYAGGKRIRKPLDTDKEFAKQKLKALLKAKPKYAPLEISWDNFKDKYLVYSRGSKKPATTLRDGTASKLVELFRQPKRLSDLTPEYLELWKGHRKAAGIEESTMARDLNAIKAMLKKAVSWGYLTQQDWASVKSPKAARKKLLFWTIKEVRLLLTCCRITYPEKSRNKIPHDWITLCMLCTRAGLRRAEALHTAWSDLDFKRNVLSVTPKAGWEPKGYEQRHIPMSPDLVRHLKRLPHSSEWVLGNRPEIGVITNYFRRIVKKAGLKGSLHTARHTFASHLAQA